MIDFLFETCVQSVYSVLSLIEGSFSDSALIRLYLLVQSLYRVFRILWFVMYAWVFGRSMLHCLHSFQ